MPITNAAIYFAKIIKTQTSGRCLAGMEIHARLHLFRTNGTVFLNPLLDAPEIDFLGGPSCYEARNPGDYEQEGAVLESLHAHSKFWFSEEDIRTHNAYGTISGAMGQPPLTREMSIDVIRRQFAAAACRGYLGYLMDFGNDWFHDQETAAAVGECNIIFEYLSKAGKLKRRTGIALVSDQESLLYSNFFANPTLNREFTLSRSGLDYDFFELRDFLKPGVAEQYRMVIFLDIRALSDEERSGIEMLKNNRRTLVFLHDPGTVSLNHRNFDAAIGASGISGIKLEGDDKERKGKIIYDPSALNKALNCSVDKTVENAAPQKDVLVLGKDVSYSDAATGLLVGRVLSGLYCTDPQAEVLGKDETGQNVFAMKKFPDWTSVYNAECLLSPPLLRVLAAYSGIEPVSSGYDVVFTSGAVTAVHASEDGVRKIRMAERGDVFELFSRRPVAKDCQTFEYRFKFGETRMFVTGNAAEINAALNALENKAAEENAAFKSKHPASPTASAFFNWHRFQRPEKYFELRGRKYDGRYGKFELLGPSPSVYLVASATVTSEPIRALSEGKIPDLCDDVSRINEVKSGNPPEQWEALAGPRQFVYAQELGIGRGQRGKVAFYLLHPTDKRVKILFSSTDKAKLYINGSETSVAIDGLITVLPGVSSLFMIELANPDGNAGFSIKFYEPEAVAPRGKQLPLKYVAKDLQIRLAPPGFINKQLIPVINEIKTIDIEKMGFTKSGAKMDNKRFEIDSDATYAFTASCHGSDTASGNILLGFIVYDKNDKSVCSQEVHFLPGTETELAKPAKSSDTVVYLKNGESWQAQPPKGGIGYVAFAVDPSGQYADLPNRNLSTGSISEVKKNADGWAITLSKPVGKNYPAGTPVRQHHSFSTFNTLQINEIPKGGQKQISGKLQGLAHGNPVYGKWWPGARYALPLISVTLKTGTLNVDNIKIKITKETMVEQK